MIAAPLRRAARPCHSYHSISPRPSAPSLIAVPFSTRSHQRRHSSSKPPVPPNDGPTNLATPAVKAVGSAQSKEPGNKRPGAESRLSKRKVVRHRSEKATDSKAEWAANLPAVPSTQHVDPRDILLASFFSLHRPISVTSPIPPSSSLETFDSIFVPRKQASKTPLGNAGEVIYTLASVVQNLDGHIANHQDHQQQQQPDRDNIISALTRHTNSPESHSNNLDGNRPRPNATIRVPLGVKLAIQELAARFRPFNVPPPPEPISDDANELQEDEIAAAEQAEEMQARQLEAQIAQQDHERNNRPNTPGYLTIQEVMDPSGRKFFTAHEATRLQHDASLMDDQLIQPVPSQRIGRIRRGGYKKTPGQGLGGRNYTMFTLSVKRQRKLKMKKHKYKKLMRKTRNLRRRLDRL